MDELLKKQLQITACKVRMGIIEGVYNAKSGHPGGSLSIADVMTYLYFAKMNIYPDNPKLPDRDRFVLSKGHTAPALYSTLANRGYFPVEELKGLRHIGSYKVYAILGDGEIEEGQVWEAAMFAAHNKLDNLVAIVDNNGLQIDGKISDVCSPYPITDKFAAFGWHVITMDAHDFDSIEAAFNEAETVVNQPVAIVMSSTKGKGVSFMENQVSWHGTAPNAEQYEQAMTELKAQLAELEG